MDRNSITEQEIWAYISKTADGATKLKVEHWMESSEYDSQLFADMESIYKTTGTNVQLSTSVDTAKDKFFNLIEPRAVSSFPWTSVLKYAAILIFVLSTAIITYQNLKVNHGEILVDTTFGEHKKINLSDGSVVWLNASSKLWYSEATPREIYLEGEAFFEVAKDKKHPFIVRTKDHLNVKALGTSFNVKSYVENSFTETILYTGKVEVTSDKYFKDKIIMHPNDKVVFVENTKRIVKSKAIFMESAIAWREGKIQFDNKPFNEIVKDLSIQYNVKIDIENTQLSHSKFTGFFDISTPISEILGTLKLSKDFEFKQVDSLHWSLK